jgi:glycosyltransferase involved in cell wall biosynthesis
VLFVHSATLPPLGADTWVHAQIMRGLDRAAYDVHAACVPGPHHAPTPTFRLLRTLPDVRILPVDLGPERLRLRDRGRMRTLVATAPAVPSLVSLARYVRRHGITIIHTSDRPRDAAACIVLAEMTGAACVVQAHVGYGDWMSGVLKWSLRRADALIGVSEYVARTLVASGHDPARVHAVHNALDAADWEMTPRQDARRRLGLAPDTPVILTVCRLFPSKGPGDLVEAMGQLKGRHPDVRLLIAGREMVPGYADELIRRAGVVGARVNVTLLGQRDDVKDLMAAADVFAMPSVGEPFGLVYLEAMASCRPVVALDSGGAPEVIVHGETGLLSPPGDMARLVANLSTLLDDATLRATMGRRGRRRVESEFPIDRMVDGVARVYRSLDGAAPTAMTRTTRRRRDVACSG